MRSLGITSYLAVPLLLGRRPTGAVTFVFSDSGRTHTSDDVLLAEELARLRERGRRGGTVCLSNSRRPGK